MKLVEFAVRKPVPVNLLLVAILATGVVSGLSLRREFFPETNPDQALITLPFPGATPQEVEESLAIKVEDALVDLDEIDEVRSTLAEGGGGIIVEFREGVDPDRAVDEVERTVNALQDLPDDAERITVALFEPKLPVIRVALYGAVDEPVLKDAIRGVRDDLLSLPDMGEVLIDGVRDYELRVDVHAAALLEHGVSLPQVAAAVRGWMAEVPGGTVKGNTGYVRVRTMGVPERREAVRDIVVKARPGGGVVRVRDIGEVDEGFVDEQVINRFNGRPAAGLTIFKVGEQDVVRIAEMVRYYVLGRKGTPYHPSNAERARSAHRWQAWQLGARSTRPLPAAATLDTTSDLARFVEGRLDLLTRNATSGAVLVFAVIFFFLNWRVALWVLSGLVTAILGTLVLMSWLNITLNLLTMFGLIIALGMLVDDGIVVAENIQTRHDQGEDTFTAAIRGTVEVFWPVIASVTTTIVAFLPLTFIKGRIGDLLGALPLVVACALFMSLVEAIVILPSHLAHTLRRRDESSPGRLVRWVRRAEAGRDRLVERGLIPAYGRAVAVALNYRFITLAAFAALLLLSLGMVAGGRVGFTFLSRNDSETIVVDVRMPIGAPVAQTQAAVARIEAAALAQPETRSVSAIVGQRANVDTGQSEAFASHVAQLFVELSPVEERTRPSSEVIEAIRTAVAGQVDDVERLSFEEISGGPGGADITVRVRGEDAQRIDAAVRELKGQLASFAAVREVNDDNDLGQLELRVNLKPAAAPLGLQVADAAAQVRGALFGIDAHVYSERQEDIDVRVRLDEATRRSLAGVESLWIITPAGAAVPLAEVADLVETTGYASIKRINRQRAVSVSAETAPNVSPESITEQLDLGALRAAYPDLAIEYAGRQEQLADAFGSLPWGALAALVMIFIILAFVFDSYLQPLLIMSVIPFALIGVVWGHFVMRYEMTFLSMIGFVALTGIVVNNAIIIVEFYNVERRAGRGVADSLIDAGKQRLRPIILTTVTTCFGLLPLIFEQSFQAKFLIPMGITLSFGLAFATLVALFVLPCLVRVLEDLIDVVYALWHGRPRPPLAPAPPPAPAATPPPAPTPTPTPTPAPI